MLKTNPNKKNTDMTMTVGELKEALSAYPDDVPVIATWEGTANGIRQENFEIDIQSGRIELWIRVDLG